MCISIIIFDNIRIEQWNTITNALSYALFSKF